MIPIGDENPREKTPYVTYGLLAVNVLAFLATAFPSAPDWQVHPLVLVPAEPTVLTLFTSMFLHANLAHILGNMLFLWIFGDNVEDKLGHVLYLGFYLAAGLAADALHILTTAGPDAYTPTLGASGAISGVLGAYVVFFPRHRIKMLLWIWWYVDILRIPAFWWAGIWFAMQFIQAAAGVPGVAHFAHIGGFVAGVAAGAAAKYLLFPARFGLHGPGVHIPSEILAPSRTGTRLVEEPVVTVEPAEIEFLEGPHERFAVLRTGDELTHVHQVAALVQRIAGVPASQTARRLTATRGVIARGLERAAAEKIQQTLHAYGIPAMVVPDDRAFWPPPAQTPESIRWNEREASIWLAGEERRVPWNVPFLYLAASVGREPFVDLFVNPRARLRATSSTLLVPVHATHPGTLHALAADIVRLRSGAALNEGIRVLAGRGRWGWLEFASPDDYEQYAFWAYNIVLSQAPIMRL